MPRSLLIDVPLGMLVGVAAVGTARFSGWARSGGYYADYRGRGGGPLGPRWQGAVALGELSWWLVPVVTLIVVAVALRRQRPLLGFVLALVGGAGYLSLGYPHGPVLAALVLTAYVLGTRSTAPRWWPWSLLVVPMLFAGVWPGPQSLADPDFYAGVVTTLALTGAALAVGTVRRTRRDTTAAERELVARRYAYQERLRIARDVHDVVGHSLSVITMQAGVALHVAGRRPEQAEESLRAIRTTSANALAELRATLDTFRDPDFGPGEGADVDLRAPQPGLAQVDGLVESLASAGRTVTVRRRGDDGTLPVAVDQALYRIVQESLTNVVRHAPGSGAEVVVEQRLDHVVVMISDHGPGASEGRGEGSGIAGMRERAKALGGTLQTFTRAGDGFVVRAELPLADGGRS